MSTIRKASLGSISHGTLRSVDLLGSFEYELRRISADEEHVKLADEASAREDLLSTGAAEEDETDSELVNALCDALNDLAPAYCYFGAHDGDGSDFGFWPVWESVEELPAFDDLSNVPDDIDEDFRVVNDHGNVSIYDANHVLIWDCV